MELDATAFIGEQGLLDALKGCSHPVDCSENRVLFRQGDEPIGMFIVHRGEVNLTMRSAEGDLLVDLPTVPGSLLGLPGAIGNKPYSLTAEAGKGAEVSFVSKDEFARLMLSDPALSMMILKVLAAEVRSARIAATNLSR